MEYHSPAGPCPPIPDDLTIPQFQLDTSHPTRPVRTTGNPWLVDVTSGKPVSFEEIRARTFGLANTLSLKWGVGEDDVVCIFSPNHVDYLVVVWAVHRLGGILSPANPSFSSDELLYQIEITKSSLIVTESGSLETALSAARAAGIPKDRVILIDSPPKVTSYPTLNELIFEGLSIEPHFVERKLKPGEAKTKLAFLSCSSGTTGRPKAVAIPHYALIANVIQMAAFHKVNEDYTTWDKKRFRPGDVALAVLPFYHIYGLVINTHFCLFCGLSIVIVPKFNFEEMLKSIVRYRVTHLLVVPPQVVLLCKHPAVRKYNLDNIRFVVSGAAPLSPEITLQATKVLRNAEFGQGYGLTETCTTLTMIPITQRIALGCAGQLMPGTVARVVKPDGTLAGYGEEGELVVKGPQMALRYLNNEKATEETFVDGWVRTGDEVLFRENGDMFVVDRLKEILKVRGFQVAPAELEGHLLDHPSVADVCVVGVADDFSGEVPLAFVVLDGKTAKAVERDPTKATKVKTSIAKHVSDAKINYKWLAGGVEFVDVIPKNPSGKLLRRFLRDKAKQMRAGKSAKAKL